jgi:hypothetical protein
MGLGRDSVRLDLEGHESEALLANRGRCMALYPGTDSDTAAVVDRAPR